MKVLIDMNLSPRWVDYFADVQLEAVHWVSLGPAPAPDADIMAYAEAHNFIVLTNDLDFGTMLATTGATHPTVVQIRADDLRIEVIGASVLKALDSIRGDEVGALITIDQHRTRVRVLPFPKR